MQKAAAEKSNDLIAAQLAPVGRETVQDRVYSELRRALIGGLFEPSQVLTIRGLADALVTSTMPVREALGRLITEKALEALPNRSVRVPPITLERIDDLLRARMLIEGEAIALAAKRMGPKDITVIEAMLHEWDEMRALKQKKDVDREVTLNQTFHFEIYRACGSAVLIPMIESLWLQSGPCIRVAIYAFSEAGEVDTAHYHRSIVAALAAQDADAARAALVADISRPFTFLRNKLQTDAARI
ncbi:MULTISPECIES: GntR family transcriptional regulator [unclassified Rhizobium]|uniref:GntR family transcriptional regulator n=1 Tax=unclassified Rhizobium TaxID=2613769 RepID=UPI001ADAA824|nr:MULTISPECIES: GntR family transcriptional regulator [unclassified Rhizobium]MBO9099895.1 GntR family transcriptional regulator [Rhizobium sp. L58/93]MBO9131562.1 GntR family transcriptional regulator [Rhizobium sp. B209b/85]MBO9169884.1 GntR family transcriptional regulator [Rhizobium sp. L245/93]MBO9185842.1 GntR family transcriptional regulator [Rhizobium sp. E27B/91]QXZ82605.1 GntR family transcriptional regulator [Rhizobium sp. K1/93]